MIPSLLWEQILDTRKIVKELKHERARLDRAIAALGGPASSRIVVTKLHVSSPKPAVFKRQKRGGMTPECRKPLSLAMKRRWAAKGEAVGLV
jgi:hypothetical protein